MLPSAPPEIVVAVRPEANLTLTHEGLTADPQFDVTAMNELVSHPETTLQPLFGLSEARMRLKTEALAQETGGKRLNLSRFYRLQAPENQLQELVERLSEEPAVETVFWKPGAVPAMWRVREPDFTTPPPSVIPDFTPRQRYLGPSPDGIDAHFAWTQPGGRGTDIRIIDVEAGWRFSHQDLRENQGGVIGGVASELLDLRNHGTAVLGIFSGDDNGHGVTGICPEANVSGVSILGPEQGWGTGAAIFLAADRLRKGDILLIELQAPGPARNFEERPEDQDGYIPIEWWPDCLEAIKFATDKGIVVVAAAGNGNQDLDSEIFDQGPQPPFKPFPSSWSNPFRRGVHDSGSIIVGAGAPPPTQGISEENISDRSRLRFSNFGSIVDAQGWGDLVVTCGFGSPDAGGTDEDFWYTMDFNGTSSAAPMIAGALGCVQGILKAKGRQLLTSHQARELLRMTTTGAPQGDVPTTKRIGNRPDLKTLIEAALATAAPLAQPATV